jgi:hypothetical protein
MSSDQALGWHCNELHITALDEFLFLRGWEKLALGRREDRTNGLVSHWKKGVKDKRED